MVCLTVLWDWAAKLFKYMYTVPKYAFKSPLVTVCEMCGSIVAADRLINFSVYIKKDPVSYPACRYFCFVLVPRLQDSVQHEVAIVIVLLHFGASSVFSCSAEPSLRPEAGVDGDSVLGAAELFMGCWTRELETRRQVPTQLVVRYSTRVNSYIAVSLVSLRPTQLVDIFTLQI